jgi:hypothetical protein
MHLTYHKSDRHTSEVSTAAADEAGAPEVEITPEMIAAGSEEIWDSGFAGAGDDSVAGLCERVLLASLRVAGFAVKSLADH